MLGTANEVTEVPYLFANGVRLARVAFVPNQSITEIPFSGEEPTNISDQGNQSVFFMLGDHLGSTSVVLDKATSELVERTTYQAYGTTESDYRPASWGGFRADYRFTGKEEDSEVGLVYFPKRYLNTHLQRWVSADPLTVHLAGADLNAYAYVSGAALKQIDPLGLEPGDVWLYQPDGTPIGVVIRVGEALLSEHGPAQDEIYVHASLEIEDGDHFSSGVSPGEAIPGAHIENGAEILDRMVDDRTIDVYRPQDPDSFDSPAAQEFAEDRAEAVTVYGFSGVCSTEVTDCAAAGNLDVSAGDSYNSPADIASSPSLAFLGRYDHEARVSTDSTGTNETPAPNYTTPSGEEAYALAPDDPRADDAVLGRLTDDPLRTANNNTVLNDALDDAVDKVQEWSEALKFW